MPDRFPTSPAPARTGIWTALLAAALLLVLPALLGYGIIDDAYISLRYARNLSAGHGLVFNPGDHVEGYSNLLWTLCLAAMEALRLDGPQVAVLAGQLFGVAALLAAGQAQRYLQSGPRGVPGPAPVYLAIATSAPFLAYIASGLEVGLYAALLMAGVLMFLRHMADENPSRGLLASGCCFGLACLTRPEAPLLAAYHGAWLVLDRHLSRRERMGRLARFGTPVAALVLAQLVFRLRYYSEWLPNTYYAKVDGPSAGLLGTGGTYAWPFLLYGGGLLATLLVLLGPRVRARPSVRYLLGYLATYVAGVVVVGGDHMALFRFFAPAVPAFALLTAVGVEGLFERFSPAQHERDQQDGPDKPATRKGWVTFGLALLGSLALAGHDAGHGQTEHERATVEVIMAEQWGAFGDWLVDHSDEGDAVALLPIGAIGYRSGRPMLDMVGLTDAHIAHAPLPTGDDAYLGHEKFDNDYVLARRPRFVLAHQFVANSEPIDEETYLATAHYPVHRALLRRADFHAAYAYRLVTAGPARYFFFYERRSATGAPQGETER